MALTGIQIFKFLPGAKKTENANCKKCGFPTCMAFAMKLAKGDILIEKCPFIDDELRAKFSLENRKPQEKIEFGNVSNKVVIGDENVMFRHDKTFVNPPPITISLSSEDENFDFKLEQILTYKINRVGQDYGVDAVAIIDEGNSFLVNAIKILNSAIPVILITSSFESILKLTDIIKREQPLVYLQSQDIEQLISISKMTPIIVDGESISEIVSKTELLVNAGCKNMVLSLSQDVNSNIIEPLTFIRRSAIEDKFEPLGFPVMMSYRLSGNVALDTINLSALLCKYTNLILIDKLDEALLTALITLRLNIYTDPQKPLQVEPKLYEIGDVDVDSPVIVTTNFALTYFAVVNELEGLAKGVYLVITNSDGMSVLTAWSASKFTGEIIARAVRASNVMSKVNHKNIVIPGLVSDLKEEIEDELAEYNIVVGPNEATDLPDFLIDFMKN